MAQKIDNTVKKEELIKEIKSKCGDCVNVDNKTYSDLKKFVYNYNREVEKLNDRIADDKIKSSQTNNVNREYYNNYLYKTENEAIEGDFAYPVFTEILMQLFETIVENNSDNEMFPKNIELTNGAIDQLSKEKKEASHSFHHLIKDLINVMIDHSKTYKNMKEKMFGYDVYVYRDYKEDGDE